MNYRVEQQKCTSIQKLRSFAEKCGWLELYESGHEVGFLTPNGEALIAYVNLDSSSVESLIDVDEDEVVFKEGK